MTNYKWFESDVPAGLEIRQIYGFIFNSDGQLLLLEDEGTFNLPGGKPENEESMSDTLIREAIEEVQISINSIEYLGYQLITEDKEFAQVRLICLMDEAFPSKADPSTGRTYSRVWVPPIHANNLLDWGESGDRQIESATERASKWGVASN